MKALGFCRKKRSECERLKAEINSYVLKNGTERNVSGDAIPASFIGGTVASEDPFVRDNK